MTSIDNEELGKFNKTMEEWWDLSGEFKLLHKINPVRLEYILGKIKQHFKDSKKTSDLKLLDVGCGGGLISIPLAKEGFKVTGIDANESNIKASSEAANHYLFKNTDTVNNPNTSNIPNTPKEYDINFHHVTAERLLESKKDGNGYDVILALEIIEHVAGPEEFLLNLSKLLNPGGMIIISTLNRTIKSYMLAIVMAEYILGFVPKKTHDYSKFIKPSEVHNMLKNSELSLKELKGMVLDLSSNKWQLSNDIDVNYFAYLAV